MKRLTISASIAALAVARDGPAGRRPADRRQFRREVRRRERNAGRRAEDDRRRALLREPDPVLQGSQALGSQLQAAAHVGRQAGPAGRLVDRLAHQPDARRGPWRRQHRHAGDPAREDQPAARRRAATRRAARDSQKRTDPNAGVFTDRNPDAGYNAFWIDPGSEYAKVNGEWRSSWITSPANGQVPLNRAGNTAAGSRMTNARTVNNTGPEIRTLGDRCLVSFANQGGPPLTNAMYNNNVQIVQTPDHVKQSFRPMEARSTPWRPSRRTWRGRRRCWTRAGG